MAVDVGSCFMRRATSSRMALAMFVRRAEPDSKWISSVRSSVGTCGGVTGGGSGGATGVGGGGGGGGPRAGPGGGGGGGATAARWGGGRLRRGSGRRRRRRSDIRKMERRVGDADEGGEAAVIKLRVGALGVI